MSNDLQRQCDALQHLKQKIDYDLQNLKVQELGYKQEKDQQSGYIEKNKHALDGYKDALEMQTKKMRKAVDNYKNKITDLQENINGFSTIKDVLYRHGKGDDFINNLLNPNEMGDGGGGGGDDQKYDNDEQTAGYDNDDNNDDNDSWGDGGGNKNYWENNQQQQPYNQQRGGGGRGGGNNQRRGGGGRGRGGRNQS